MDEEEKTEEEKEIDYEQYKLEQKECIDAIIKSSSNKKIIAAGPGTGKTSLFTEICKKENDNSNLVLTFINELVNDLKKDLGNFAEVRTLHSFAKKILKGEFYMKLTEIIEEDFKIIKGKEISFKKILSTLEEESADELIFYSSRRKYYNHFGPYCSVYTLIKRFEEDKNKIPKYSQILIDEFQDFNKLEIRLIDLLAEKSPILIVGDDDQSLYSFKDAYPDEICLRCQSAEYISFKLPFCFRCTKVIVNAVSDIILKAKKYSFFKNRIEKDFRYFHSEEKDKISNENPQILIKRPVYEAMLAYQISKEIGAISESDKNVSVLIICTLPRQIKKLEKELRKKGFKNIQVPRKNEDNNKKDGYKLLLRNEKCNLGWRILSRFILNKQEFEEIIRKSFSESMDFDNLLKDGTKKVVKDILKILKKIQRGEEINKKDSERVFKEFNHDPYKIALEKLKEDISKNAVPNKGFNNINIRITTLLGSKGLTSDYVFLVNFDDRFIFKKMRGVIKVTDENIRQFIVAITRAKKRLYIYSGENKQPTFISWLNKDLYNEN